MDDDDEDRRLAEQLTYYRARAPEYDAWITRTGRYDRGPEMNASWHAAFAEVRAALGALPAPAHALDLAAGTGQWSAVLAERAGALTVVDGSPEMLARNRERVAPVCAARGIPYRAVEADLFAFAPADHGLAAAADLVLMGFWLSHVPAPRLPAFLAAVRAALRPGGRVFVVDSLLHGYSGAKDHPPPDLAAETSERLLDDGRRFTVVKRFFTPETLAAALASAGFVGRADAAGELFLYGTFALR